MKSSTISPELQSYVGVRRVARLATADGEGAPHVIPICYAFDGQFLYSALDLKPKRVEGRQLKRVRNIIENPHVALVIDDYSEAWDELSYVLIQGEAEILERGELRDRAEKMLRDKYPQYLELLAAQCTILKITPASVVSWGQIEGSGSRSAKS